MGQLVRMGAWLGRKQRPTLKIGICGEHGGDPESIAFFASSGIDYVSCSPPRVPGAAPGRRPGGHPRVVLSD